MTINTIYLSDETTPAACWSATRRWMVRLHAGHGRRQFEEIAQALIDGDTDGWTIERYDHHEQFRKTTSWPSTRPTSGTTVTAKYLGIAASQWLGIEDA